MYLKNQSTFQIVVVLSVLTSQRHLHAAVQCAGEQVLALYMIISTFLLVGVIKISQRSLYALIWDFFGILRQFQI